MMNPQPKTTELNAMSPRLPTNTHIGSAHLYTADLSRSLKFYGDTLGFREIDRNDEQVTLSADGKTPHILLTERPGARPKPRRTTGLYHVAIRYADRNQLARAFRRVIMNRYPLGGASDHGVSEALYLDDPDGNGLEMYTDRSRDHWPMIGDRVDMVTQPLDLEDLLRAADDSDWMGAHPGTDIGHVHLHVSDLNRAKHFYVDLIGLDLMQDMSAYGALFVAAGGYHHHLGLNTWAGSAPQPPGTLGLRVFELVIPEVAAWEAVQERLQTACIAVERIGDTRARVHDYDNNALELATP